jgi:predicted N-acetyltransferase YhbS
MLAKLALDMSLHGQGLGTELLVDAFTRSVVAADQGPGARVVIVDAIDASPYNFYVRHGFKPMPEVPMRLYRRVSDIVDDLSA